MGATLSRMLWFFVFASLLSYATYLVVGNIAHTQSSGERLPVIIRDELGKGVHHLSGMIMVPTVCDELSVRTESISETTFALTFRTWRQPSVDCPSDETPRYFRALLFAPSTGIEFIATLDGVSFPIAVLLALPDRAALE